MLHIYSIIQKLHQEPLPGEMYHSNGLKILNLDFTIFCCGIFYSIILIVLCRVNYLKSGKVYPRGIVSLAKFFKMTARSSAKSELRVNTSDFEVVEHDQIISGKQMKIREPLCI